MRIGCLQFAPQVADTDNNLELAEEILTKAAPKDLDLLVLPELAFAGYNFKSLQQISPYLEFTDSGITSAWARSTALKYDCTVVAGYPEKLDPALNWPTDPEYYNSAMIMDGDGDIIGNYQKSHLYYTDETWALEGIGGFYADHLPILGRTAMGICMDLNPYRFESPWTDFEFAHHVIDSQARLVIVTMAWNTNTEPEIFHKNPHEPDMETLAYWLSRLEPIISLDSTEEVVVVFANRAGTEDDATYAGTSAVVGIKNGEVRLYGMLGRGEQALLVVDTEAVPFGKLQMSAILGDVPNTPSRLPTEDLENQITTMHQIGNQDKTEEIPRASKEPVVTTKTRGMDDYKTQMQSARSEREIIQKPRQQKVAPNKERHQPPERKRQTTREEDEQIDRMPFPPDMNAVLSWLDTQGTSSNARGATPLSKDIYTDIRADAKVPLPRGKAPKAYSETSGISLSSQSVAYQDETVLPDRYAALSLQPREIQAGDSISSVGRKPRGEISASDAMILNRLKVNSRNENKPADPLPDWLLNSPVEQSNNYSYDNRKTITTTHTEIHDDLDPEEADLPILRPLSRNRIPGNPDESRKGRHKTSENVHKSSTGHAAPARRRQRLERHAPGVDDYDTSNQQRSESAQAFYHPPPDTPSRPDLSHFRSLSHSGPSNQSGGVYKDMSSTDHPAGRSRQGMEQGSKSRVRSSSRKARPRNLSLTGSSYNDSYAARRFAEKSGPTTPKIDYRNPKTPKAMELVFDDVGRPMPRVAKKKTQDKRGERVPRSQSALR